MPEIRTTSSTGGQKGVKLERHDLIPTGSLELLAIHFGRGARKYDPHQWRKGYEWSKSYSAMMRHMRAFWSGEDFDACPADGDGCMDVNDKGEAWVPEEGIGIPTCWNHTGSLHVICAAWHAFVLAEFRETHPDHDDRYIPDPPGWMDLNETATYLPGGGVGVIPGAEPGLGVDGRRMGKKFDDWYDRQSLEVLFLIGVSPLILVGVILTIVAIIWG